MSRNYSNVGKRLWTDKYVHEHNAYDKNNAEYVNLGVLSTVDVVSLLVERMCGQLAMCKCTKSCNKTTYLVSKRNSVEKETSEIFDCTR